MAACSQSQETWVCLLQFLSVMPEEISAERPLSLSEQDLDMRVKELLTNNAQKVLDLLLMYINTTNSSHPNLVFACLMTWLQEINIYKILSSPLFDIVMSSLSAHQLFDAAVDLIVALISETRDVDESIDSIKILYPKIIGLRPMLERSFDDVEAFRGLARIFSEAGEAWVVLMARLPEEFRNLVECVAMCASFNEDLEVTKFSFNFWYDLAQLITLDNYAEARKTYEPVYSSLVDVLIAHLHFPDGKDIADSFDGDREAEEKFRSFRYDMGDVLKDCCRVVGGPACLQKAFNKVQESLAKSEGKSGRWQDIEAPLFAIRQMGRQIKNDENRVVPDIMKLLVQLPENDKIRYSATLVLGRYTEWTAQHPEYLEFQLNYISSGFNSSDKDVTIAAAHALRHFCRDCNKLLINHVSQLHPFYQHVSSALDFDSLREVTEGIAHVIAVQPLDKVTDALVLFCEPLAADIMAKLPPNGSASDTQICRKVADDLDLISIILENALPAIELNQPHPAFRLVEDIWKTVVSTMEQYGHIQFISERACKCVRTMTISCGMHLRPLLPSILQTMVSQFRRLEYGSYLWASGTIVRRIGSEVLTDADKTTLWQFVDQQSVNMFGILNNAIPEQIPDLVEDFFRMLLDALMCNPLLFIASNILPTILQATLVSLSIGQFDALMAVLHFLRDFLAYASNNPPTSHLSQVPSEIQAIVQSTITANGQQLTTLVMKGLILSYPPDCIPDSSAALMAIIEMKTDEAIHWLNSTVQQLPKNTLSIDERTRFVRDLKTYECLHLHLLTYSAVDEKDFKRVRRNLQDFTARYRRRMNPRASINGSHDS